LIKKHPDALKAFAIAEQAGFTEPSLYLQRGESYAAMGRLPEALDAYTAALAKPQAPESERVTRTRRAETAVPLQKYDVAVLDFKQLLKDKPADKRLLVGLGMAYIGQKDADSAIATFDSALAAAPIAHAHYGRALAHDLKGNKTSALKDLDIAIAMAPQQIVYRNQRDKTTAGR
jgi:tetratricopeptide (TPR) repeat protein